MEIIKQGKPAIIMFKCSVCKCIFKANQTEYRVYDWDNETVFYSECPNCNIEMISYAKKKKNRIL